MLKVSPSSRGRGLKSPSTLLRLRMTKSPSSRGRGLKRFPGGSPITNPLSPSSRGRGLKYDKIMSDIKRISRPLHEGVD